MWVDDVASPNPPDVKSCHDPRRTSDLRKWQGRHSVPVTGRVDSATWKKMLDERDSSGRGQMKPAPKVMSFKSVDGGVVARVQCGDGAEEITAEGNDVAAAPFLIYQCTNGFANVVVTRDEIKNLVSYVPTSQRGPGEDHPHGKTVVELRGTKAQGAFTFTYTTLITVDIK